MNNRDTKGRALTFAEEVLKKGQNLATKPVLEEFIEYWTQPNQKTNQLHFETQPAWDTTTRIKSWVRNEKNTSPKPFNTPPKITKNGR